MVMPIAVPCRVPLSAASPLLVPDGGEKQARGRPLHVYPITRPCGPYLTYQGKSLHHGLEGDTYRYTRVVGSGVSGRPCGRSVSSIHTTAEAWTTPRQCMIWAGRGCFAPDTVAMRTSVVYNYLAVPGRLPNLAESCSQNACLFLDASTYTLKKPPTLTGTLRRRLSSLSFMPGLVLGFSSWNSKERAEAGRIAHPFLRRCVDPNRAGLLFSKNRLSYVASSLPRRACSGARSPATVTERVPSASASRLLSRAVSALADLDHTTRQEWLTASASLLCGYPMHSAASSQSDSPRLIRVCPQVGRSGSWSLRQ